MKGKAVVISVGALLIAAGLSFAMYLVGVHRGQGTANFSGTILLSNYDNSEGCIRMDEAGEVCGAFVSTSGGGNGMFKQGVRVSGRRGTLSVAGANRTIMVLDPVRASP